MTVFRLQVDSRMGGEETVTARLWAVLQGVVKFERGGREEGLLILHVARARERGGEREGKGYTKGEQSDQVPNGNN